MRNLSLCLIAAGSLATAASAQQYFEIFPDIGANSSRGNVFGGAGEVLQGWHELVNRGVGDVNCVCAVDGLRMVLQDQLDTTQEVYHLVFRSGTDAAGPDATLGGYLGGGPIGPFLSPLGATAGPNAWFVLTTFTTPLVVPCEGFFAAGIEFGAQPLWSTDGISIHLAIEAESAQHAGSVDMAWQVIGGVVSHPSAKRSWRFALCFMNAPVFQIGNSVATAPLARFGNGGYYPNTALAGATSQGISARCTHPAGAAASAIILLDVLHDLVGWGTQSPVSGLDNCLYLQVVTPLIALPLGPADGTPIPLLPNGVGALTPMIGAAFSAQGLVVHTGGFDLTNAIATYFL